jgi:hypothetical protein
VSIGLAAGLAIVFLDNVAFGGEVSPIVVVVMLLLATGTAAGVWGRRGWIAAAAMWICLPLAHAVKHLLDLPDTLHPNTWASILKLAVFTVVVAAAGTGLGMLIRGGAVRDATRGSSST